MAADDNSECVVDIGIRSVCAATAHLIANRRCLVPPAWSTAVSDIDSSIGPTP